MQGSFPQARLNLVNMLFHCRICSNISIEMITWVHIPATRDVFSIKRTVSHNTVAPIVYFMSTRRRSKTQFRNCRFEMSTSRNYYLQNAAQLENKPLGTVRMMHRRQWIRKQFPIYFLWFSYLQRRMKVLQNETYINLYIKGNVKWMSLSE